MATDNEQIASTEQLPKDMSDIPLPYWQKEGDPLPDDPLLMPPPYWRNSGATFHMVDTLQELVELFRDLTPLVENTNKELDKHYEKYPEFVQESVEEGALIVEPLQALEQRVQLKIDLVIFMAAIALEDSINMFCVYNLHKDIAESIEKLPLPDKFLVACAVVGKHGTKSNAVFEGMKRLTQWRNKYAHGHCVDRPTESLRHNHLIQPKTEPNVWLSFNALFDHCQTYFNVQEYLRNCSLNPYVRQIFPADVEISALLDDLSRYSFIMPDDSGENYSLVYDFGAEKNPSPLADLNS